MKWTIEYIHKNATDTFNFGNEVKELFLDCRNCEHCLLFDELLYHILCNSSIIKSRKETNHLPYHLPYDQNDLHYSYHIWEHKFICRVKNKSRVNYE